MRNIEVEVCDTVYVNLEDLVPMEETDLEYLAEESGFELVAKGQLVTNDSVYDEILVRHEEEHAGLIHGCMDRICDVYSRYAF